MPNIETREFFLPIRSSDVIDPPLAMLEDPFTEDPFIDYERERTRPIFRRSMATGDWYPVETRPSRTPLKEEWLVESITQEAILAFYEGREYNEGSFSVTRYLNGWILSANSMKLKDLATSHDDSGMVLFSSAIIAEEITGIKGIRQPYQLPEKLKNTPIV